MPEGMDEADLREIERNVATGWTLPVRVDAYALDTMTALVAEIRRLQEVVRRLHLAVDDARGHFNAAQAEVMRLRRRLAESGSR